MTAPAYPAARAIAARVRDHQARLVAALPPGGEAPAPVPEAATIETVIDAAFWASLRREEGYVPQISLAFLEPQHTAHPLIFERPLPLHPAALVRLAPAVERPGIHLGVGAGTDGLVLWGTTRAIPPLCLVVEDVAPGLLVVKCRRSGEAGKFANLAVLQGDETKIVAEQAWSLEDCPPLLRALLGFESSSATTGSVNVLIQLAVSMRAHGRGGSLLVVPAASESWRESIFRPIPYAVSPPFQELARLMGGHPDRKPLLRWQESLRRAVDHVAGLTAVDGATLLTDRFELLAFGATIVRRDAEPRVEQVVVTEPVEGAVAAAVHPAELGGTRHLSAAQFVQDQRDAIALVASQDGRFTVFAWSPHAAMVHAHRIETLLL